MMTDPIIPREQVAEQLGIAPSVLVRYESRGLVRAARLGPVEGYAPSEVRRVWTIVTFQRDLGINLAGVEVILRLREQMEILHNQLHGLASDLRAALESEGSSDNDA